MDCVHTAILSAQCGFIAQIHLDQIFWGVCLTNIRFQCELVSPEPTCMRKRTRTKASHAARCPSGSKHLGHFACIVNTA